MSRITKTICDNCGKEITTDKAAAVELNWVEQDGQTYGKHIGQADHACSRECLVALANSFWTGGPPRA